MYEFAQSLLCKTVTPISTGTDTFSANGSNTITKSNTYSGIIIDYKITIGGRRERGLSFQFDDVTYTVPDTSSWNSSNVGITLDLTPYAKGAKTVIIQSTYGGNSGRSNFTINYKLGKVQGEIKGKPKEIRAIGDLTSFIFYGFYGVNDTDYIGGLMQEKSNTATTGSITLGNAVGYITVNLNGEIVKIPYYGS